MADLKHLSGFAGPARHDAWRHLPPSAFRRGLSGQVSDHFSAASVASVDSVLRDAHHRGAIGDYDLEEGLHDRRLLDHSVIEAGDYLALRRRSQRGPAPAPARRAPANSLRIDTDHTQGHILKSTDDLYYVTWCHDIPEATCDHYVCDELPGLLGLLSHLTE